MNSNLPKDRNTKPIRQESNILKINNNNYKSRHSKRSYMISLCQSGLSNPPMIGIHISIWRCCFNNNPMDKYFELNWLMTPIINSFRFLTSMNRNSWHSKMNKVCMLISPPSPWNWQTSFNYASMAMIKWSIWSI